MGPFTTPNTMAKAMGNMAAWPRIVKSIRIEQGIGGDAALLRHHAETLACLERQSGIKNASMRVKSRHIFRYISTTLDVAFQLLYQLKLPAS